MTHHLALRVQDRHPRDRSTRALRRAASFLHVIQLSPGRQCWRFYPNNGLPSARHLGRSCSSQAQPCVARPPSCPEYDATGTARSARYLALSALGWNPSGLHQPRFPVMGKRYIGRPIWHPSWQTTAVKSPPETHQDDARYCPPE
ncbi:hypothetical protein M8818_005736 [Zalaria obscura]|uniref:Uncharacterized protein n=1 Tax=Zalaria obscura TaxID=2024903 RepID=A0ACC3S8U3_9PEZI